MDYKTKAHYPFSTQKQKGMETPGKKQTKKLYKKVLVQTGNKLKFIIISVNAMLQAKWIHLISMLMTVLFGTHLFSGSQILEQSVQVQGCWFKFSPACCTLNETKINNIQRGNYYDWKNHYLVHTSFCKIVKLLKWKLTIKMKTKSKKKRNVRWFVALEVTILCITESNAQESPFSCRRHKIQCGFGHFQSWFFFKGSLLPDDVGDGDIFNWMWGCCHQSTVSTAGFLSPYVPWLFR